jgi:ATP-dependent protease ClpP protease subunit
MTDIVSQISPRVIEFKGSLTDRVAKLQLQRLQELQESSEEILCEIDCAGGSFDRGFEIFNALQRSSAPIRGVVNGRAFSAGFMILQGCHVRSASENDAFKLHAPEAYTVNTPIRYDSIEEDYIAAQRKDFHFYQPLLKKERENVIEILLRRNKKIDRDKLESILNSAQTFLGREAFELGFLDCLIPSPA